MQIITNVVSAAICTLIIIIIEYKRSEARSKYWKRIILLLVSETCAAVGCIINEYSIADILFTIFLISNLYLFAIEDVETRTVFAIQTNVLIMAGVVYSTINITDGGVGRIIIFCIIFLILWIAGRKEKLGIGMGDIKIIAASALFWNAVQLFSVLFLSLFIAIIYGIYILIKNKSGVKTEIPFIPFILAGTIAAFIF